MLCLRGWFVALYWFGYGVGWLAIGVFGLYCGLSVFAVIADECYAVGGGGCYILLRLGLWLVADTVWLFVG